MSHFICRILAPGLLKRQIISLISEFTVLLFLLLVLLDYWFFR